MDNFVKANKPDTINVLPPDWEEKQLKKDIKTRVYIL